MIKVLLVDDEKLALEYLEQIIDWEHYGFEIIGVTTDAEQALRLFRKYRPELVISDVKMPTMDGLALASMIRELDKRVHILFLSGYKNFSYVKQAIRLDIDDYLLKSDMDEETFIQKILGLKGEIEKEKAKNQYTTDMILESLFHKNESEDYYKKILDENEFVRIQKRYYYIIVAKNRIPRFMDAYVPTNQARDIGYDYELRRLCQKYAPDSGMNLVSVFMADGEDVLCIVEMDRTVVSQQEVSDRMYGFAVKMQGELQKIMLSGFCLYYYAKGCSVRRFGRLYEEKKTMMWRQYVNSKSRIEQLEFELETETPREPETMHSVSSEEIYQSIKSGRREEERWYLEMLKQAIRQEDYVTYLWYAKELMNAISRFEGGLMGKQSGRRFSVAEGSDRFDFHHSGDMVRFIEYKIAEITCISNEHAGGAYSEVIRQALEYMQKNLGRQDLSANIVAQQVNLSNSWLSTKFKEEVGVGISDYLNGIRIQEAKHLFDQGNYMIYEVAEKTGFASSQYFSKIFKQFTGLTPNEYKRKSS